MYWDALTDPAWETYELAYKSLIIIMQSVPTHSAFDFSFVRRVITKFERKDIRERRMLADLVLQVRSSFDPHDGEGLFESP
jgi:hypothetical protein